MNINYKEMDYEDVELFSIIEKWHNDKAIRKNFLINLNYEDTIKNIKAEDIRSRLKADDLNRFVIYDNDKAIGEFNYHESYPVQQIDIALWVGISIGDQNYHGKGVGKKVMNHLEDVARKLGKKFIEIGVYEYNTDAFKFYEKLGYSVFDKSEKFIYWDEKKWSAIKMLKSVYR